VSYDSVPFGWKLLTPLAYRLARGITIVTKDAARDFKSYPNIPCILVPGPVEPFSDILKCTGVSRFFSVGRLHEQKGFDRLIKAFWAVNQRHPESSLVIYGDGPARASLEQLIRELRLISKVSLPGAHSSPFETSRDGDCFVLSSRFEGFPLVLAEAMLRGLPVISFDCPGGPKEMITDNLNGILIPEGDINGLAQAMNRMIEDPELVAQVSQASPSVAQLCSPRIISDRWVSLLSDIRQSKHF
jgi:glycosyltransferase involved in cell wall biosynthesis